MKILILTYGSRGDVQPYVALGKALQRSAHQVTLATSVRFQGFVEGHGLRYAYMNDDLLSLVDTDEGKELMEKGSSFFEIIRQSIKLRQRTKPANISLLYDSWQAAQDVGPDVIVFGPKAAGAPSIAEKLGIGCVLAAPIPMFVPTAEWRFPIFPNLELGGRYNRATFHLIQSITNLVLKTYINDFRQHIGLSPDKNYSSLTMSDGRPIPILHAFSKAVLPRPADWPDHAHITGYWFLGEEPDWTPPPELQAFLEAGPPPVYVGFGSMAGRDPARLAKIVVGALQKAGLRGIVATGWGGLKAEELPETVLKIEQAPHGWLLPKVAAVVHHGGAGTTAAGLRAGKPSIIVPFFADQPFWGARVHALGAGPKPLSQKKLSADLLAAAMRAATTDQAMIETAAEIGRKIRAEDGVANAVALVERYAQSLFRSD